MARKGKNKWVYKIEDKGINSSVVAFGPVAFPILGSKSAVKKAIAGGRLFLNGKPATLSDILKKGDRLELRGAGFGKAKDFETDLEIIYKDDSLLVIKKPAGIAVNGARNKTVENALAGVIPAPDQKDALPRPVAVHRIDVPTTGLVLLARTKSALIALSRAFQENEVKKEYFAVVHGKLPEKGRIDKPVNGKSALTEFETIRIAPSRVFGHLSLVRLHPITGRTHQLRIHLKSEGHLIVGDKQYADGGKTILGKGLYLSACRLQFNHPETGKPLDIRIPPPVKFERLLEREKERYG